MPTNREIVIASWTRVFVDKDVAGAAAEHLGATYTQHNPQATDGAEGLLQFTGFLAHKEPDHTAQLCRVVAEGDLVATHARFDHSTGPVAAMDFWRLEDGKTVEHWDAIQPVPPTSRNDHGTF